MNARLYAPGTIIVIASFLLIGVAISAAGPLIQGKAEEGWKSLFNGKDLEGWHMSTQTGHSRASNHKSAGRWVVEDGAILGSQDIPGNGGIIVSDEKFSDFEIVLEMNNDYGPDSGLFLRSTEKGKCYQAMIDYHDNGTLMGIYGEGGMSGRIHVRNFNFLDAPHRVVPMKCDCPLPVLPESFGKFWRHGQWNELRARIVGNPPAITTWINGVRFMDWKDSSVRHPHEGHIALQVHGGGDFTKQYVRYRNIRIKPITPE